MIRDQCIDLLYAQVAQELPMSRSAYEATLEGWDIAPLVIDDTRIGVMLLRGYEIHMQIDPAKALLHARRIIRQYVVPLLAEFGHLTTRTLLHGRDIHFLRRLGFVETSRDSAAAYFRLDALKIK